MLRLVVVSHPCVVPVNRELFGALARFGAEVVIVAPAYWESDITGETTRTPPGNSKQYRLIREPIVLSGRATLHAYTRLPLGWLRRYNPDLLFVDAEPWSLIAAEFTMVARLLNCPFVFYTKENILRTFPFPLRIIRRLTYGSATGALSISDETTSVLRRTGFRQEIAYLPHTISPERHYQVERRESVPGSPGQNVPTIGYLGRLVPEKGVNTLLEALALLHSQHPDLTWRGLIVGDGSAADDLRRYAAQHGIDRMIVFQPAVAHGDVAQVYAGMDVVVLPSRTTPRWKEQFGRVVIEALACGVPVVGSNSGEIPYLIARTGGGLVFPEGDASALAAHLARLLKDADERRRLACAGRQDVLEHYTPDAVARELYENLTAFVARDRRERIGRVPG